MEFLYYVAVFFVGWKLREIYAVYQTKRLLAGMIDKIAQEKPKDETTILNLEKHHDVLYAYTKDGKFMGQGSSLDDLIKSLSSAHPGESFAVEKAELEKLGIKV